MNIEAKNLGIVNEHFWPTEFKNTHAKHKIYVIIITGTYWLIALTDIDWIFVDTLRQKEQVHKGCHLLLVVMKSENISFKRKKTTCHSDLQVVDELNLCLWTSESEIEISACENERKDKCYWVYY